jgi:hypothetical protein
MAAMMMLPERLRPRPLPVPGRRGLLRPETERSRFAPGALCAPKRAEGGPTGRMRGAAAAAESQGSNA